MGRDGCAADITINTRTPIEKENLQCPAVVRGKVKDTIHIYVYFCCTQGLHAELLYTTHVEPLKMLLPLQQHVCTVTDQTH